MAVAHRRKVSEPRPCFHILNRQPHLRLEPSVPSPEVDARSDPDHPSNASSWFYSRSLRALRSHHHFAQIRDRRAEEFLESRDIPDRPGCTQLQVVRSVQVDIHPPQSAKTRSSYIRVESRPQTWPTQRLAIH